MEPTPSMGEETFLLGFLLALVLEHAGFIFLSKGMKQSRGELELTKISRFLETVKNPWVVSGVLFQAIYYVILLGFLQRFPVSLVVPMTGFGYVLTAILARAFLKERVSSKRWVGILLITSGVVLVSRS